MERRNILFLDMDGVLADFESGVKGDLKNMFKKGFFKGLNPMEKNLNETIRDIKRQGYSVKILSKACVKKSNKSFIPQVLDKVEWIKNNIPCIDELDIIIQATDESKGDILEIYKNHNCILVDDYSKNLLEWTRAGGQGIKRAKRIKNGRDWKQILNLSELALEGVE